MARSMVLGSGIAGAVVAAAMIVVVGSTAGLTGGEPDSKESEVSAATFVTEAPLVAGASELGLTDVPGATESQVVTTASGEQVEYVYVDAPASARYDDDDDEHEDEHEDDDDHEDERHESAHDEHEEEDDD